MKILIPNSYCFAAIGIIKTLKRLSKFDVYIVGTGEEASGVASGSLLVDKYIKVPHYDCKRQYEDFIDRIVKEYDIDLAFGVLDSDLPIMQAVAKRNRKLVFISPSETTVKLFRDKLQASIAVSEFGINIPEIILDDAYTDIICRKKVSVGSSGIHCFNVAEQSGYGKEMSFLQKKVSGDEYTVDVMCDKHGSPHIIIPRKRIEIRNGMSFKTSLIEDVDIINCIKRICKGFVLPGLWNAQFIKKESDLYFIELNPRFAGSAIAGIAASFNYLDVYIDHFCENIEMPPYSELNKLICWGAVVTRYYEECVLFK